MTTADMFSLRTLNARMVDPRDEDTRKADAAIKAEHFELAVTFDCLIDYMMRAAGFKLVGGKYVAQAKPWTVRSAVLSAQSMAQRSGVALPWTPRTRKDALNVAHALRTAGRAKKLTLLSDFTGLPV